MASRSVSPGGALLRSSRMFSIPPPLPRPVMDSSTATSPHPLHLSVTTPYASLQRGDWGFKRPLPLRSTTRTSTPVIRVQAIDTHEHITDFRSAADHTLTLQKWQEMDTPLTVPTAKAQSIYGDEPTTSVFEDAVDRTTNADTKFSGADSKWRFKGPWLAGQSEGEFIDYLKTDIRQQKSEFRNFIRSKCATALTKLEREKTLGEDEEPKVIRPEDVTEVQLNDYTKRLRKERKDLYAHINEFLDLAPMSGNDDTAGTSAQLQNMLRSLGSDDGSSIFEAQLRDLPHSMSPYRKTGPPKTHPSAGLSYSRTAARVSNHPEFGPQAHKTPVEARIVLPRVTNRVVPAVGVGGFVAEVPGGTASFQVDKNARSIPGLRSVEPDKVGGSKIWVHPRSASIDEEGKVKLHVDLADQAAVAVKQGNTQELQSARKPAGGFKLRPQELSARPTSGGSNSYFAPAQGQHSELVSFLDSVPQ